VIGKEGKRPGWPNLPSVTEGSMKKPGEKVRENKTRPAWTVIKRRDPESMTPDSGKRRPFHEGLKPASVQKLRLNKNDLEKESGATPKTGDGTYLEEKVAEPR